LYEGDVILIDEYGSIKDWPDGFADIEVNMCEEIIMIGIEKRKQNRSKNNAGTS
jgi:hypothetical protein